MVVRSISALASRGLRRRGGAPSTAPASAGACPGPAQRSTAGSNVSRSTGLATKSFMPALRQARLSSRAVWAVSAITGTSAPAPAPARRRRVTSQPSMPGMATSISTAA